MKTFLWADDNDELHFNSKDAREWALKIVDGKEPQTKNIKSMPTQRFIKYFWDAVIMSAYGLGTDAVFIKRRRD